MPSCTATILSYMNKKYKNKPPSVARALHCSLVSMQHSTQYSTQHNACLRLKLQGLSSAAAR